MLLYADEVWRRTINFFNSKRGSWIRIRKILFDTALIMLEGTMFLAIILLLVQYRFQNHWSDGNHNAKVRTVHQSLSTASQYNVFCFYKVFCNHCCAGKHMNSFCNTYLSLAWPLLFMYFFLSVINFTPITRVLVIEAQSLVVLICIW